MWVVREISFETTLGDIDYVPYHITSEYGLNNSYIRILLLNTATRDEVVLDNHSDENVNILGQLKLYKPYGYVPQSENLRESLVGNSLVCIDDLSLQFLGYVEHVSPQMIPETPTLKAFTRRLRGAFYQIDNNRSLFKCNIASTCLCTLFHAILFCPDGWLGDNFYLYTRRGIAKPYKQFDTVYKITFNDVVKAKRFITKAKVAGLNPVKDILRVNI